MWKATLFRICDQSYQNIAYLEIRSDIVGDEQSC